MFSFPLKRYYKANFYWIWREQLRAVNSGLDVGPRRCRGIENVVGANIENGDVYYHVIFLAYLVAERGGFSQHLFHFRVISSKPHVHSRAHVLQIGSTFERFTNAKSIVLDQLSDPPPFSFWSIDSTLPWF